MTLNETIEKIEKRFEKFCDKDTEYGDELQKGILREKIKSFLRTALQELAEQMGEGLEKKVKNMSVHLTDTRFNENDPPKFVHTVDVSDILQIISDMKK